MVHVPPDFKPLDPGRIHADDPFEIIYWSMQLGCTPEHLSDVIAAHGEHVTVVREALAQRPPEASEAVPAPPLPPAGLRR